MSAVVCPYSSCGIWQAASKIVHLACSMVRNEESFDGSLSALLCSISTLQLSSFPKNKVTTDHSLRDHYAGTTQSLRGRYAVSESSNKTIRNTIKNEQCCVKRLRDWDCEFCWSCASKGKEMTGATPVCRVDAKPALNLRRSGSTGLGKILRQLRTNSRPDCGSVFFAIRGPSLAN